LRLPSRQCRHVEGAFEGRLELLNPAASGGFATVHDLFSYTGDKDSPWRHLPSFSFEFVQNGSHLIPVQQGLIFTGIRLELHHWSGPRVAGRKRLRLHARLVSFLPGGAQPELCYNGEMMFLFSNTSRSDIKGALSGDAGNLLLSENR